jgi:hypothetical protein
MMQTARTIPEKSHRTSGIKGKVAIKMRSSILASVHALEMPSAADTEPVCASALCDVRFKEGGIEASPRRYCSDSCKQQASLIRRTAKLFELTEAAMVEMLRKR